MTVLETIIISYDDWRHPWKFNEFVTGHKELSLPEIELFNEIYNKAGDINFWNRDTFESCSQACDEFIKTHYNITDDAASAIVRALSYQWK